ncbi:MAG: signal peptidase II [Pseudooceanicola sp.]|jgi:signal peptidase II|nr:signal peptidase II [Pseudooceanicola sp.]
MRPLTLAALLALILDQVSKYWVVHAMSLATRYHIDVFPPLLRFRYGENRGINFGLLDGNSDAARWALIGFSLVVCAAVAIWIWRRHPSLRMQISAGLVIGGALGNVVDRVLYGYVLDFLNMSCCGITNPFVFNVADVFIFAGALGLIVFDAREGAKTTDNAPKKGQGKNAP